MYAYGKKSPEKLELAQPGDQIFGGNHQFYNVLITAYH